MTAQMGMGCAHRAAAEGEEAVVIHRRPLTQTKAKDTTVMKILTRRQGVLGGCYASRWGKRG